MDLSKVGPFAVGLENVAFSVIALEKLTYFFRHSESDPSRQLHLLRSLRERFDELRALCDAEPELVVPKVTIAAPVPVAAKPVVTGNQLGTLATLAAA